MKNSKNKFLLTALAVIIFSVINSCKDKFEPQDVEFTINTGEIRDTIDNIVDDSSGSDKFYVHSLIIDNNFYRNACENNNVYLGEVSSVTISEAKITIVDNNGVTLDRYASIIESAEDTTEGSTTIAQTTFSGGTSASLSLQSDNLLKYFKYYQTNIKIKIKQSDPTVPSTAVNFSFSFKVKGKNHQ